jgi:hypothetical protein
VKPKHEYESLGHLLESDGWAAVTAALVDRRESAVKVLVKKGVPPEDRTETAAEIRAIDSLLGLPHKRRDELARIIGQEAA